MNLDPPGYYYPEHHTLGAIFTAAADHVQHTYASKLGPSTTYVGYSQGATMGALMLLKQSHPIENLLLIEGGYEYWSVRRCLDFKALGGERVYFACGTRTCHTKARSAAERLLKAGIEARVGYAEGAGHTPAGEVGVNAEAGLRWLLEKSLRP